MNHRIHNIYKAILRRELTHTQYLKKELEDRTKTYTISIKLFRGSESSHTQYLQNYSRERINTYTIFTYLQIYSVERTNTYQNIYKTFHGSELTHTTMFTKLFKGEN